MKLRKLIRIVHRDLGYIFFATSIIYGMSGIALNHMNDWNPSYIVTKKQYPMSLNYDNISEKNIKQFLATIEQEGNYKKHIKAGKNNIKVFIKKGSIILNFKNKTADLETIRRRPIFHQFNFLHYNSARRMWTWFADTFAASLIILAITGLFMVKGKNGIKRRGAVLTAIGIAIPLTLFLMYA